MWESRVNKVDDAVSVKYQPFDVANGKDVSLKATLMSSEEHGFQQTDEKKNKGEKKITDTDRKSAKNSCRLKTHKEPHEQKKSKRDEGTQKSALHKTTYHQLQHTDECSHTNRHLRT